MRERMTRRRSREQIAAEIEKLQKEFEAMGDDETLKKETDAIVKEEVKIVNEGSDVKVKEVEDQNAMSMDNWPVPNRDLVAARLLKLAKALLDSAE